MDVTTVGRMREVEVVGLDGIWIKFVGVDNLAISCQREAEVDSTDAGKERCNTEMVF